jgi:hypothetical protein
MKSDRALESSSTLDERSYSGVDGYRAEHRERYGRRTLFVKKQEGRQIVP